MRKIATLGVVAVCVLTLSACGNSNNQNSSSTGSSKRASTKVTKTTANIHTGKDSFIYSNKGKVEIVGFKKDTVKSKATTDVKFGESVYLVELKVTNNTKKEMSISDLTKEAKINFYQSNDGNTQKVETATSPKAIASDDETNLSSALSKDVDNYHNKITAGKTVTLLLPNVIHLDNKNNPLIIQAGNHDNKDRLIYSIKQLDEMEFDDKFSKNITDLNSTDPDIDKESHSDKFSVSKESISNNMQSSSEIQSKNTSTQSSNYQAQNNRITENQTNTTDSSQSSYNSMDDPNSAENKAAHAKGGMLYGAPDSYTTGQWQREEDAPTIKYRAEHGMTN